MGRRIDPCSDYGFKTIFGKVENKKYLISFLNSLLKGEYEITDVLYIDKEQCPESEGNRTMFYDVYCTTNDGRHVICEMQNAEQSRFGTRSLCYASNAIMRQCRKGKVWHYDDIKSVVCISVLNFISSELSNGDNYRKDVTLMDCQTKMEFSDDLRLIYLTLPKFTKKESECCNDLEHWLFSLKHMETMEQLPDELKGTIFEDLWNTLDYYSLPIEDQVLYERVMKRRADERNIRATAEEKGLEKGIQQGIQQGIKQGKEEGIKQGKEEGIKQGKEEGVKHVVLELLKAGVLPLAEISKYTGSSLEQVEELRSFLWQS
jgi:predicted transposase/invertase (TIGR01784 family)